MTRATLTSKKRQCRTFDDMGQLPWSLSRAAYGSSRNPTAALSSVGLWLEFEEPLCVQVSDLLLVGRADRQIFEKAFAVAIVAIGIVDREQDPVDSDRMQQADERGVVNRAVRGPVVPARGHVDVLVKVVDDASLPIFRW